MAKHTRKKKRVRGTFPWSYFTIGEDILPQFLLYFTSQRSIIESGDSLVGRKLSLVG
jgi:hypothetical protein